MGVKVEELKVTAQLFENKGNEALKKALEKAGYYFPEATQTLLDIIGVFEYNPIVSLSRINDLSSLMTTLEQQGPDTAGGDTPEPPAPSATVRPEPSPAGFINIFGTYQCITTDVDTGESETSTITLRVVGDNYLAWIDEDGSATTLAYNRESNSIADNSLGPILKIKFSQSGDTIIGIGYFIGDFWDDIPVNQTISLTKISD